MLSFAAAQLTREYRDEVALVAQLAVSRVDPVLRSFDPRDMDAWWLRVAAQLLTIATDYHDLAATLADRYLRRHGAIESVDVSPVVVALPAERAIKSLRVQTVARAKKQAAQGVDLDLLRRTAVKRGRGVTHRLALSGSRQTIMGTFDAAPVIVGYRRVTESNPCSFCSMLAGRGAVYRSQQRASSVGAAGRVRGNRRVGQSYHDNCRCTVEPLYDRDL